MKKIYYFTSTGNTLTAAKDLAAGIGAELEPIAAYLQDTVVKTEADVVGIAFPVYLWGLPLLVVDFLKKLRVSPGTYLFGLATYGGMIGGAMFQMDELLKAKGMPLSSGLSLQMPGNYTPLYGASSEKTQAKQFSKAKEQIKIFAEKVNQKIQTKVPVSSFLVKLFFYDLFYKSSIQQLRQADKGYLVEDTCNSCGICQKVCPVNNIQLENGKPVWLHHCEHCLACLQWCPVEAIQFSKSKNRKRYHYPGITFKNIEDQKK